MGLSVRDYIYPILLIILFFILIAFRLIYFTQAGKYPGFANYIDPDDQYYYHNTALSIADGNLLGHSGALVRSPGYIYFAALLYAVSGNNTKFVLAFQMFLGVLTGLLIYLIGKNVFDNKLIGLYAGFFYAFYLPVLCYETAFLMCALITFLISLGFLLFIKGIKRRRNLFFLSGLILGWAFICRPNNIFLAGVLIFYLIKTKKEYGLKPVVLFISGFFVFYFLLMIRNICAGVNPFMVTTQGQLVLLAGHAHYSQGVGWLRMPAESAILSGNFFVFIKNILYEITSHFPIWITIQLNKCYAYFFNYEYPQFIDFYIIRETVPILNIPSISFGIISPLALLGLWHLIKSRKNKFKKLFISYFFALFIGVILFYVISRFRMPAIPFFCVLSGYALNELKGQSGWRFRLISFTVLILLFFVFNRPKMIDKFDKMFNPGGIYNRGILYFSKNINDKAIGDLEYVMRLTKSYSRAPFLLGVLYEEEQNYQKALKWLYYALLSDNESDKASLYGYLGKCHFSIGEYDKSIGFLKKSLKYDSDRIKVLLLLAQCYLKSGKIQKSKMLWKDITLKYPYDFRAFYNLGNYYLQQDDKIIAYSYLSKANELNPNLNLKKILTELKKMNKKGKIFNAP